MSLMKMEVDEVAYCSRDWVSVGLMLGQRFVFAGLIKAEPPPATLAQYQSDKMA